MKSIMTRNCFVYSLAVCGLALCISGCARNISSSSYDDATVGVSRDAHPCVVVKVRRVKVAMNMKDARLGAVTGAVTGGALGHFLANDRNGHGIAAVAGGLAGGLAGAALEQSLTEQDGLEYTVRLRSGDLKVVVQGFDAPLHVGDRALYIAGSDGRSRVIRDNSFDEI